VTRLDEDTFRWTAADPSLRWFSQNAIGLDVAIEDISEQVPRSPCRGRRPEAARRACGRRIRSLKYFRMTRGTIAGVPVDISRTGYTGDLGYEIWMPWDRADDVWDALMYAAARTISSGRDARPRCRAGRSGLLLIEVDFNSSKKALIESQKYSPYEMGTRPARAARRRGVRRPDTAAEEHRRGRPGRLSGSTSVWPAIESLYEEIGLAPQVSAAASRVRRARLQGRPPGRPRDGRPRGSPVLKKID
jgi:aminomethyltransferase